MCAERIRAEPLTRWKTDSVVECPGAMPRVRVLYAQTPFQKQRSVPQADIVGMSGSLSSGQRRPRAFKGVVPQELGRNIDLEVIRDAIPKEKSGATALR